MESITVRVVDQGDDPVEGKKVTIFLTHQFLTQTRLSRFTDDDGRAYFDFADCLSVSVYVNGQCQLEDVSNGGGEVTVSI